MQPLAIIGPSLDISAGENVVETAKQVGAEKAVVEEGV